MFLHIYAQQPIGRRHAWLCLWLTASVSSSYCGRVAHKQSVFFLLYPAQKSLHCVHCIRFGDERRKCNVQLKARRHPAKNGLGFSDVEKKSTWSGWAVKALVNILIEREEGILLSSGHIRCFIRWACEQRRALRFVEEMPDLRNANVTRLVFILLQRFSYRF